MLVDSATMKAMKISRFERVGERFNFIIISLSVHKCLINPLFFVFFLFSQHLHNSAAFKARTKARSKFRDKRVDVGEF